MGEVLFVVVVLVLVSSHLSTARRIIVARPCTYDSDCDVNAYCKMNTQCECKTNHFIYKDATANYSERCLPMVTGLEAVCEVDDQCQIRLGNSSFCEMGTCQCRRGARFIPESNRCVNTSTVGGPCLTSLNCYVGPDVRLSCKRSVCVCPWLMHANRNNTACLNSTALGGRCTNDEECVVPNSACDGVCRCDNVHIANFNNTICLKAAEVLGHPCTEEVQCSLLVKDATCKEGQCACIDDFHAGVDQNQCWRNVWLDDPCNNNNECMVVLNNSASATCSDGVCKCPPGHRPEGVECISEASSCLQSGWILLVTAVVAVASGRL